MAEIRLDNARHEEQIRRMQEAQKAGKCYLCEKFIEVRKHFSEPLPNDFESPLHIGHHWFVKVNDFPYKGAVHHYLIVSTKHITDISEIDASSGFEFFRVIRYLEDYVDAKGFSVFVRSGDMAYTGATLDHLHFHFVVGERKTGTEPNNLEDMILAPIGYKQKPPTAP